MWMPFFSTATYTPELGSEVLCRFKSGNYMVCRYECREGRRVFVIPSGWYCVANAYWLADAVEAFALLPNCKEKEK